MAGNIAIAIAKFVGPAVSGSWAMLSERPRDDRAAQWLTLLLLGLLLATLRRRIYWTS